MNFETEYINDHAYVLCTNNEGITAFVNSGDYKTVDKLMNKSYLVYETKQNHLLPIVIQDNTMAIEAVASGISVSNYSNNYSINGIQLAQPQKGLNILKMTDGTTRKVVK